MRTRLIGLGAAGNKAAIEAVERGTIPCSNVMLLNSTLKDIPADYITRNGAVCYQFTGAYGGCGKERSRSYELCSTTLENDDIKLGQFLGIDTDEEAELVVLVSSTEGGTGSGASPLVADYINQVYGLPVHIFGLAGFEDDVRGMRNTVDFFKDMKDTFAVECISNQRFLDEAKGNRLKAEALANTEFATKLSVLMGIAIRDAVHNIDPTDLLKLSTQTGYMMIETYIFKDKIKTQAQFQQAVTEMIAHSKALDPAGSEKKLGVIINIREEATDYIDYSEIEDKFGVPYERYEHIQHEEEMPEFISFIAGGLDMPIESVEETYNKYKESLEKVNKASDNFFSKIQDKSIDSSDHMFDLDAQKKSTVSKDSFFKNKKAGVNKTVQAKSQSNNSEEY